MKLGKKAAVQDPRTLKLAALCPAETPAQSVDWGVAVEAEAWGTLGNDVHADCTAVACCNLVHVWKANIGTDADTWAPTTDEALALYSATSGYPEVDEGAVVLDVLNYWHKHGIPADKDPAIFAAINPADVDDYKLSIQYLGGVYLGLRLPLFVQGNPEVWDVPSPSVPEDQAIPGSWGGHAVAAVAYDAQYLTIITWGTVRRLTWDFVLRYCDEVYGVVSKTWLDQFGMSPSWLLWDQIQAKLTRISE